MKPNRRKPEAPTVSRRQHQRVLRERERARHELAALRAAIERGHHDAACEWVSRVLPCTCWRSEEPFQSIIVAAIGRDGGGDAAFDPRVPKKGGRPPDAMGA